MVISVSVMSSLAVIYAMLQTWSWYRRSGRFTVDLVVMFKFVLFALGDVADAIFVVIFAASLYHHFLYKVLIKRLIDLTLTYILRTGWLRKVVTLEGVHKTLARYLTKEYYSSLDSYIHTRWLKNVVTLEGVHKTLARYLRKEYYSRLDSYIHTGWLKKVG